MHWSSKWVTHIYNWWTCCLVHSGSFTTLNSVVLCFSFNALVTTTVQLQFNCSLTMLGPLNNLLWNTGMFILQQSLNGSRTVVESWCWPYWLCTVYIIWQLLRVMFVMFRWAACALVVQVHVSCASQTADYRSSAAVWQAGLDWRHVRAVLAVHRCVHVSQLPAHCCRKHSGQLVQALKEVFQQCHGILARLKMSQITLAACSWPVGRHCHTDEHNRQMLSGQPLVQSSGRMMLAVDLCSSVTNISLLIHQHYHQFRHAEEKYHRI